MYNQFQNVEVPTLLMRGRSTKEQRLAAWSISVFISCLMLLAFWYAPVAFEKGPAESVLHVGGILLDSAGGAFIIVLAHRLLFPEKRALIFSIRSYTPIGYIETKDHDIFDAAYLHVLDVAKHALFEDALKLSKYDPHILTFGNLRVIASQRKGTLEQWLNSEERLQQACHFLYLCYRAEQKREDIINHGQTDIF